ncbi:hypothetical protein [Paenibacillus silagei]|uniref:Collagen-like protein n=1 Tax=Paenibacillus silagei TaxID=1670801 RepID=A0ABS4P1P4_9BACL|nr:hypothetical protein [Paenibacillus silagei]MBP2116208.1 hypothetical protein [Paenibacillus silagei]
MEQVSVGFVAFYAGFQHQSFLLGRITAHFAGFLYNVTDCGALGPSQITAAPIVFGFSPTFGPRTSALPNVFGFPHTFGPRTSALPNLFGFPPTFGPHASRLPNVFGFSPTFGPGASSLPKVFGFSLTSWTHI